jgi:hypothetical protein
VKVIINLITMIVFGWIFFGCVSAMDEPKKTTRSRLSSSLDLSEPSKKETFFSISFLKNLIEQIKENKFEQFDVVFDSAEEQIYDCIYIGYPDVAVILKKIDEHLQKIGEKSDTKE